MSLSVSSLSTTFLHFGVFGLFLLAFADDSFLFLPVGADLVTVLLVAREHSKFLICVSAAAAGSTLGVVVLDFICRKGGEKALTRMVKPKLLAYLKQRMERRAGLAVVIACIAPPPFPFGAVLASASAFQYPRARLLTLVFMARSIRFSLVGCSAIYFGRRILRIANSTEFLWVMGGFIALCLIGSIVSVVNWVRIGSSR